jgi:hypothetical protein
MLTWDRFPSEYLYARLITRTATIGWPVLLSTYGRLPSVRVDDDGDAVPPRLGAKIHFATQAGTSGTPSRRAVEPSSVSGG